MAETQTNPLRIARLVLWALVFVAGIGATIVYFVLPPQQAGVSIGGSFDLASTEGGRFTNEDLNGIPSLMFFGYTFCPDVCPTTLADTAAWREALALTADDLRIIFVTVDPERDDLHQLRTYLSLFSGEVIGLVGTPEETEEIKTAYGVFSEKVEDESASEYLVNHTASVLLIGANGGFEGTIAHGEDRETVLGKIRRLTGV
jgi:protein SCO1/2